MYHIAAADQNFVFVWMYGADESCCSGVVRELDWSAGPFVYVESVKTAVGAYP